MQSKIDQRLPNALTLMRRTDCNRGKHVGFDGLIETKSGKENRSNHCPIFKSTNANDVLIVGTRSKRGNKATDQPTFLRPFR